MGLLDCSGQDCNAIPLTKEIDGSISVWLEAAKVPATSPHLKPWEICHNLEYQILRNSADKATIHTIFDEKLFPSNSDVKFSEKSYLMKNPERRESEHLNLENGSDLSNIPESVLVRNAFYALQGVQSAVDNLENISKAYCSQPADRSSHRVPSLWLRSSSTNALGKLLLVIALSGRIYCQLGQFVDFFLGKSSKMDETGGILADNKGDKVKGRRSRKHRDSKGNKANSYISDRERILQAGSVSSPPFSLVNQAFAIALRCILQGYLAALNTLTAYVAFRRSRPNDGEPQSASVCSSEAGCLTSVIPREFTLLELYLHTGELRTHIQALGAICMLKDSQSVSRAEPAEMDMVNKQFQEFPRGADLLTYLYKQIGDADPIHHNLLKFLFARACQPYFDFIKSWLYRAIVKDPYEEFIVEASQCGEGPTRCYLSSNIRLRDGVSVPCFLKHVSTPLLRAGQQLQVLTKLLETAEIGKQISHIMRTCMPAAASNQLSSLEAILGSWTYISGMNASCEPVLVYSRRKLDDLVQKREKANQQMLERLEELFVGLSDICRQKGCMVVPLSSVLLSHHDPEGDSQKMQQLMGKAHDHCREKRNIVSRTATLETRSDEAHEESASIDLEMDFSKELGTLSEDVYSDSFESLSDEYESTSEEERGIWNDNTFTVSTFKSEYQLKQTVCKDRMHETPKRYLDVERFGSFNDRIMHSTLIRNSKEDNVEVSDSSLNNKVESEKLPCGVASKELDLVSISGLMLSEHATGDRKYESLISDYNRGTNWPRNGLPTNPFLVALASDSLSNNYLFPDLSHCYHAWDTAFGKAFEKGSQMGSHSSETSVQRSQLESKISVKEFYNNDEHKGFSNVDGHHSQHSQISCNYMGFHPLLTRNAWGHLQHLMPEKSLRDKQATALPYYDFSSVTNAAETFTKNMIAKDCGHDPIFSADQLDFMGKTHSNDLESIGKTWVDGYKWTSESTTFRETWKSEEVSCKPDSEYILDNTNFRDLHNNSTQDHYIDNSLSRVGGGATWETSLRYIQNNENCNTERCEHDSEIALEIPLDVVIDKCIVQEIMLQYRCISNFTVKLLEEGFGFQKHLLAMRRYFFMEVADWADGFVSSLSQYKWSPTVSHQRLLEVQAMLESALQHSSCEGDEYDERLYIFIKDADGIAHTDKSLSGSPNSSGASYIIDSNCLNAFDFIGLGYKVDWPLNMILTSEALNMYNLIFSFLIQIKLTVLSLSDTWKYLRELMHSANRRHKLPEDKEEIKQFRILMQFRQEVNHFIAALQQYVQSQLLHVLWHKFLQLLKDQVEDMLDLESVHTLYLLDCMHICFLDVEMRPVKELICNMMQCVLDFGSCFGNNSQNYEDEPFELAKNINYSRVLEAKGSFERNLKQLHKLYINLNEQSEISLSYFWMFLDYNEYISSTLSKKA